MNDESTIMEKLEYLDGTKESIKNAIVSKGQEIDDNTTFREYAAKIANIETGIDTSDATATALDIVKGKIAYNATGRVEGGMRSFENGSNISMPIHTLGNTDTKFEKVIKVCNLDETVDTVWMADLLSDGNTAFKKMLPVSLNTVANLIPENIRNKALFIDYFATEYKSGSTTTISHNYDVVLTDMTGINTNNRADIHILDPINYDVYCVEANCFNLSTEMSYMNRFSKNINWYRLQLNTNNTDFTPLNNNFNLVFTSIGNHWYSSWTSDAKFFYSYSTTNTYSGVNWKGDYYRYPGSASSPYMQTYNMRYSAGAYIGNLGNTLTCINIPLLAEADNITSDKIKEGETVLGVKGTYEGTNTSDATAAANRIEEGYTAYVNGEKITGTLRPVGQYNFGDASYPAERVAGSNNKIRVKCGLNTDGLLLRDDLDRNIWVSILQSYSGIANAINLTANQIAKGSTVLGVEGTYEGSGISLFSTVADMEASTAQEGDKAVVYTEDTTVTPNIFNFIGFYRYNGTTWDKLST